MRQKGKVNALSEIVFCKTLIRTQSHSYECFSRVSKQLVTLLCVYVCMLFSFRYYIAQVKCSISCTTQVYMLILNQLFIHNIL